MSYDVLDLAPLWLLHLTVALLLGAAIEAGFRYGVARHAHNPEEREQPVFAVVASILGLLALMLSFTFHFAATKFEGRRQAVVAEANAIGTTYLRSRMLPEAQRGPTGKLLAEYVGVRIEASKAESIADALKRSGELHEELWKLATAAAEETKSPVITGLYIQSLNELIDLHEERVQAALRSRIPLVLWGALISLSIVGVGAVGYESGLAKSCRSPVMAVLVLAFTVVIALIADLDRGHEGLIRVTQAALVDTQQMIESMQR